MIDRKLAHVCLRMKPKRNAMKFLYLSNNDYDLSLGFKDACTQKGSKKRKSRRREGPPSHNWHRPSVSLQFIAPSRRLIGTFNQSDFSGT